MSNRIVHIRETSTRGQPVGPCLEAELLIEPGLDFVVVMRNGERKFAWQIPGRPGPSLMYHEVNTCSSHEAKS